MPPTRARADVRGAFRDLRCLALLLCLGAASGCAGVTRVGAAVAHPAQIPIRAFPRVVLVPGLGPHDREIADALALHLMSSGLSDVRVQASALLEDVGIEAPGTAVVQLSIALSTVGRTDWVNRPDTVCGAFGCYQTTRTYPVYMPVTDARMTVVVRDGHTGRTLQEAVITARCSSASQTQMERSILHDLADRLGEAVDVRDEPVRVELLDLDDETVERAIALLRRGAWHEGREVLEGFIASGQVAALDREERARAYYDLGLARRFDPTTMDDPERHFALARAALDKALELDAREDRYAAALSALDAHREQARIVREQALALEHNRSLADARAAVGPIPAASGPVPAIRIPDPYEP
jgi:hypothetical protein